MFARGVGFHWECILKGAYKVFDGLSQPVYTSHFGPSEDERPWIRALGHLSDSLSERDVAGQLARARIGQVDGFPRLEPSISGSFIEMKDRELKLSMLFLLLKPCCLMENLIKIPMEALSANQS